MKKLFSKITDTGSFTLKPETLTKKQVMFFCLLVILTIVIRVILIPYNMMDMGDSATRVWNALWWAQKPFFVLPESGHPGWFYFMGPLEMLTKEIYYTPILTMIVLMTIAGIYIFKTTLILSDFKTALIAFAIFIFNPVIFRLNFEPYSQQQYMTAVAILIYYFIKAIGSEKSAKYFAVSGIFSFIALFSRPEAIFIIVPLCILAFFSGKKGRWHFILLSTGFQVIWLVVSYAVYHTPFQTFQAADQYTDQVNIQGLNLGLRLKGFFLPYYFLFLGLSIFVFYFFIRGTVYFYKKYPKVLTIIVFVPILVPALVNGAAGAKSAIYHTTNYIYLMFFFSPVLAAIGLNIALEKINSPVFKGALASVIILTSIPFSYIKEAVPQKYNKLFPKIIEFIVTTEEPSESEKLIKFIDENINRYPALIFDSEQSASSIYYIPYRTKLAPPEKVLISGYNVPKDKDALIPVIKDFMKKNPQGIIIVKKSNTVMNGIFTELTATKPYKRNDLQKAMETDKWIIYTYSINN